MKFQEFDRYRDVFLGSVDTPPNATIGVVWHALPGTDIAFDVKYIWWSSVRAIGTQPAQGGFGWRDRPVFLVGVQHRLTDDWTVRAGYNYGPSPIQDRNIFANALFPAIVEHHVTAGVTYRISLSWEISGSAFYGFKAEQTDDGTGDTFSQVGRGTTVDMYQVGAQIGLKFKF